MGFAVTAQQVGLMFVFIALGLLAARRGWIGDQAVSGMTNLLIYIIAPGVIINAFYQPFSLEKLHELGIVSLVDLISMPVVILVTHLLYARVRDPDLQRNLRFGGVYSNAGFLGLPLAQALLGADGVFFAVIYMVFFHAFVWTHGWSMFTSERGGWKQVFRNPAIPSVVIGIIIFLTSLHLPTVVVDSLGYLSSMNAPLSMFVVGASLATVNFRTFAADRWVWIGTAVRNLLVPAIAILALWAVPLTLDAKLTILISISCPVAAFLVVFSVTHKLSTDFPARLVCLSTLTAILTLPVSLTLATAVWT